MGIEEKATETRHHVAVVAAEADEPLALRVWHELHNQSITCSINNAHIFKFEATALLVIVSGSSSESLEFTRQVMAFRASRLTPVFVCTSDADVDLPPSLLAMRGPDGLLEPTHAPEKIGILEDNPASAARAANAVIERLGKPALPGFKTRARQWALPGGLAASLLVVSTLGLGSHIASQATFEAAREEMRAELTVANSYADTGRALIAALSSDFPESPSGQGLLALADGVEAALVTGDFSSFDDGALLDQAAIFHAIGEARDLHREPEKAQLAFDLAHQLTGVVLARGESDPDRMMGHSLSAFYLASQAYRRGDIDTAETMFETYADLSDQLYQLDPDNPEYVSEVGYAHLNTGSVLLARGNTEQALEKFDAALEIFQMRDLVADFVPSDEVANAHGWRAKTLYVLGDFQSAVAERQREIDTFQTAMSDAHASPTRRANIANAQIEQSVGLMAMGQLDAAALVLDEALSTTTALTSEHPDNIRYARHELNGTRQRARLNLWRGRPNSTSTLLRWAANYIERIDEAGQQDERKIDRALTHLIAAEINLFGGNAEGAYFAATDAIRIGEEALEDGKERARILVATAYFYDGEARLLRGDTSGVGYSLRRAREHLGIVAASGASPFVMDLQSRIAVRLGETSEARDLRAQLEAIGYARPDYLAFWNEIDAAQSVSTVEPSQGDTRG